MSRNKDELWQARGRVGTVAPGLAEAILWMARPLPQVCRDKRLIKIEKHTASLTLRPQSSL